MKTALYGRVVFGASAVLFGLYRRSNHDGLAGALIVFWRCCDYIKNVSLTEIENAVKELSREKLAKLAAFIARQDKIAWDEQLEQDFSPGGKHAGALDKIDAEIDTGNVRPMP